MMLMTREPSLKARTFSMKVGCGISQIVRTLEAVVEIIVTCGLSL